MGRIDGGTIERERKYRLSRSQATALRARLDRDATFVREETQDTTILRDRASHLKKGAYIRLRMVDGRYELTHKGPKTVKGRDKIRTEHSVAMGPGAVYETLEIMGFRAGIQYVKATAIYRFRGVLVSVDRIEDVGWFCEIETDELETDLDTIAQELALGDDQFEPRGYRNIAAEAGLERAAV